MMNIGEYNMQYRKSLKRRYLEAISSSAASLSLSNISRFYDSYIKNNEDKVKSELERVGYYTLKNKLSIGDNSSNTKDVYISTYFVNMDKADTCNNMLSQKYHGDVDVRNVGGFFSPQTNELVVLVRVYDTDSIEDDLKDSDIRSVIEHEMTHAFDNTTKSDKMKNQNISPGIGENFLSACAYLGCANRSDIADLMMNDMFMNGKISSSIHAISLLLYKLFTITEFNAHQMSDLEETHNVDIKRSDDVRKALRRDVLNDYTITNKLLRDAAKVTPERAPQLWKVIGNVLSYMGYNLRSKSPNAVYKFFTEYSDKLFKKYINRKMKNQAKSIISLKEKNNIKNKLIECISNNNLKRGISFWFSPAGNRNSYLCRFKSNDGKSVLTINNKDAKIFGNANAMMQRAIDANNSGNNSNLEFAIDNLVDIIVQSIERKFNNVNYDPVYDITVPQDEVTINQSNKRTSRFADLDWD